MAGIISRFTDGLVNALTGAGTTRDPRVFNRYCHNRTSDPEIDAAFRSSWMVRRIVEKPAGEMVREWRDWQAEAPDIEKLEAEEKRLGIREKVKQALVLAGLGGGAIVLHTAETDPSQPLNPATISQGSLRAVHVWHKSRFTLGEMIADPLNDWHGHPSFYEMTGTASVRLHPSRVIAFPGQSVPDIMGSSWEERWWGDSVVSSVLDAVANVDTAENGFAALVKDARNRRVFIPGLFNLVTTAGGEQQLSKRMQSFAAGESMYGISFLDGGSGDGKGGERIEDRQMVWAGIPEMKASFLATVAAAADMPATVLLGKSPDGMNATGAGDLTVWEKTVKTRQDMDLRPKLDRLDVVLIPSAGVTTPKVWYSFAPLSTPTEAAESTTFKTWTEAVAAVQTSGAIPEVALNKAVQNTLTERGWLVGLDGALAEIPETERFGLNEKPDDDTDPSALTQRPPLKLVANDAKPRTLYVSRKVQNVAEIAAWAKEQGVTDLADDLHVTIAYSTTPVDWIKMGASWADYAGKGTGDMIINAGGPRVVEPLGDMAAVLMFASSDLSYRNGEMRETGASWDFPDYQPHISIAKAGVDAAAIEPYRGKIVLGPEIFEEIRTGEA